MKKESFTILITLVLMTVALTPQTACLSETMKTKDPLCLAIKINAQKFLPRQKIILEGNLTQDSILPTDAVVALQIDNPLNTTITYKTITIGNPEKMWIDKKWPINITAISLTDLNNNPINTARINNQIKVHVTVYNPQLTQRQVYIAVTVYDANMAPLKSAGSISTLGPQQSITITVYIHIPNWACSGKSIIAANVYTKAPKDGGTPLTPEKTKYFCISRVQQGLYQYPELSPPQQQTLPGWFKTEITLSPEPKAGRYIVYSVAQTSITLITQTQVAFTVESSQSYPPQASFAYWPAAPYENQTVQFDASSSTPEGYNDVITSYKWNFGDGTPSITENNPYITHKYLNAGTYIITLNVTDSEGLWSTTQKPIKILQECGPTANFTWTPKFPIANQTIIFNATASTPGWSKKIGDYRPVINYKWNFGDGTVINTANPIVTHNYTRSGNYTVTLTVTDADGRTAQTSAKIQVLTLKMYDVNGDGIIDLKDILTVAMAFGSYPGHPRWDSRCDFNKDNVVDLKDYWPAVLNYGKDP
ncbi:MAG: PKD domain-containing protein [Candidatus Bathyarchaeia archaeon]